MRKELGEGVLRATPPTCEEASSFSRGIEGLACIAVKEGRTGNGS